MNVSVDETRSIAPLDGRPSEHGGDRHLPGCSPLDRRAVGVLLLAYLAASLAFAAVGMAIVRWWEPSWLGTADADVNRWFSDARTEGRTDLAHLGSMLSGTETMVAATIVLVPVCWLVFHRWHEWGLVAFGLLLEVTVFVTSSTLADRDRPPVEQLEGAPTSSWPSGHIAAAVVFYGGIAMVILWHHGDRVVVRLAVVLLVIPPAIVVVSRLYLGMHHPSDAAGGIVLGVFCLVVVGRQIRRTELGLHRTSEV